jgi:hypothetical protein
LYRSNGSLRKNAKFAPIDLTPPDAPVSTCQTGREQGRTEMSHSETPDHRRDTWGDDPVEQDADATVADLAATEPELTRRWHNNPAVVPFKAIVMFVARNGRRTGVTIAGGLLILIGFVGLALPILPGWLLIFAGLAVLSTEYVWAELMLKRAKAVAAAAGKKARRAKRDPSGPVTSSSDAASDEGS